MSFEINLGEKRVTERLEYRNHSSTKRAQSKLEQSLQKLQSLEEELDEKFAKTPTNRATRTKDQRKDLSKELGTIR